MSRPERSKHTQNINPEGKLGWDTHVTSICNCLNVPRMVSIQRTKIDRRLGSGASKLSSSNNCPPARAFICLGEEIESAGMDKQRSLLFVDRPIIIEGGSGRLDRHRNSSTSEHLAKAASHRSSKRSCGGGMYGTTTTFCVIRRNKISLPDTY